MGSSLKGHDPAGITKTHPYFTGHRYEAKKTHECDEKKKPSPSVAETSLDCSVIAI